MENINAIAQGVINEFPYEKVAAYMQLVEWKWQERIPDADNILWTAKKLMSIAIDNYNKTGSADDSTGGLRVTINSYGIKLSFEPFRKSSY